jgi:imidazolonepropionase-like amidohydrolase
MATPAVRERPRLTAVRAARLFDGLDATLVRDAVVVVDGTTIRSVAAGGAPPPDADVVELGDVTLLPGLIDAHVHLAFDASLDPVGTLAARDEGAVLSAMRAAGRESLRAGVTAVRDLGDRDYLALQLRDQLDMPTVVAAGPPITTPGGHCHFLGGAAEPTEAAVRAAVREHAERGVDIIKIMASGGTLTPGSRQELAQFDAVVLRAAVDEAHRHGLAVTAHAHGTPAIANALAAGVDGVEHVSFWSADGVDAPDDLMRALAAQRVVIGATVGVRPVDGMVPPPAVAARLPLIMGNLRRLYELGAPVTAGTDAGLGPIKPHGVLAYALPMLHNIGFSPADGLRALTSGAAAACGLAQRKGRLAAGFDADLLAVAGDPLTDPTALQRVRAVFARGRRVN